jgi:Putative peptidoglycan binding domain
MKTLLVLICSCALVCFAGAAQQQQDQGNPPVKKKGGGTAAVTRTQPVQGAKVNKFQGQHTFNGQTSNVRLQPHQNTNLPGVQSTAKTTTFNKTNTFNKNVTVNKTTFHAQHFNLANKWNPNVPKVAFKANNHIPGSQKWNGAKYAYFKNYHSEWHDRGWWSGHHDHIVFVFGGWYAWDNGYYIPAWGYAPDAYYAYDGPIYTGSEQMDPGQTVANIQSALQQQGFYQGDIDGIFGPQTRAALAEYQQQQGLEPTGAIDEPTIESLNMAS